MAYRLLSSIVARYRGALIGRESCPRLREILGMIPPGADRCRLSTQGFTDPTGFPLCTCETAVLQPTPIAHRPPLRDWGTASVSVADVTSGIPLNLVPNRPDTSGSPPPPPPPKAPRQRTSPAGCGREVGRNRSGTQHDRMACRWVEVTIYVIALYLDFCVPEEHRTPHSLHGRMVPQTSGDQCTGEQAQGLGG